MPMGMADIAVALWSQHYSHNPANPHWMNRDSFVISNGHGSMLHYALLHLTGYDLPMSEIKNFRQMHSKTPGHPEVHITPGVETTTGPLGQGITNAVGMALAEKLLAAEFNQDGLPVVDHYTYVFLGDGCLMEGISHEACSLAGTLGLNKLICLYDDNGISIDGHVEGWFADDTPKRFEAYGWNVIPAVNGHDPQAVSDAIAAAKKSNKPTMICCKTVIGQGSPNMAGTHNVHGAALGDKEIAAARAAADWNYGPFEFWEYFSKILVGSNTKMAFDIGHYVGYCRSLEKEIYMPMPHAEIWDRIQTIHISGAQLWEWQGISVWLDRHTDIINPYLLKVATHCLRCASDLHSVLLEMEGADQDAQFKNIGNVMAILDNTKAA